MISARRSSSREGGIEVVLEWFHIDGKEVGVIGFDDGPKP